MPTAKQEAFCIAYVQSGKPLEAYRSAGYGPNMTDKTAGEAASRLLRNGKVIARLDELRRAATVVAAMTINGHLTRLQQLSQAAESDGKFSAAVAAEVARGKVSGFYVERLEHSGEVRQKVEISRDTATDLYTQMLASGARAADSK